MLIVDVSTEEGFGRAVGCSLDLLFCLSPSYNSVLTASRSQVDCVGEVTISVGMKWREYGIWSKPHS